MTAAMTWISSHGPVYQRRRQCVARGAVLIIDNHTIVREGLRGFIDGEHDLFVCAEADTARDARVAIKERTRE